jgi:hypothetical protein
MAETETKFYVQREEYEDLNGDGEKVLGHYTPFEVTLETLAKCCAVLGDEKLMSYWNEDTLITDLDVTHEEFAQIEHLLNPTE